MKRQGGEAATLHRPPERANAALKDPAFTQNMDSHSIYSQPVRGQGRGASCQGVRRPGRRGCQRAQNGLGETGGLTYAPRPPGVTRRTPDIASGFTHSKLCISHDGMQAGRLLAREQVQQGVGIVRDPFLAEGYIRRTSPGGTLFTIKGESIPETQPFSVPSSPQPQRTHAVRVGRQANLVGAFIHI